MENTLPRRISKAGLWVLIGFLITLMGILPVSALAESSLPEEKAAEYQSYISIGQQHLDNGRYREAIAQFNRALLLDPSSEEAKEGIIKANREIAERSAVPDVASIEKDRLNYHLTKGTEYYDAEKFDEAIAEWREVLQIDPENRLAHSLIDAGKRAKVDMLVEKGHDEFFAGDIDEAIAIWEEASEIVPASTVLDDLLAEAQLARHEREMARLGAERDKQFMQISEFVDKQGLLPEGAAPDGIKWKDISEKPKPRKYREFGTREAILKELSQPVAFEFECEPLRDVLRFLTSITGINILVDEEVFEKFGVEEDCYGNEVDRNEIFITIHVSELPLESALNGMFRQHGLGFLIERDFIYISTPDVLRGSSFEQLETRFYHLKDTSRVSLPKLEGPKGGTSVSLGAGGKKLDLTGGKSVLSGLTEVQGSKTMELDADYESMSFPKLVNILRTFVPTVVDQSKSEKKRAQTKVTKDKLEGGMETGTDQIKLFESPRQLWVDSRDRQILSLIDFDPHTNTLIARNTPSNLETLEVFLDHLDTEPRQVAVEAKFITYSIVEAEKVGIDLDIGGEGDGATLETSGGDDDTINFSLESNIADSIATDFLGLGGDILFRFTKDDGDFLEATINMLSELKNTRTISAPRLVSLHNKPAVIQDVITQSFRSDITIETNIVTVEGSDPVTTTSVDQEFTDVTSGVSLSITPQIQPDDTIRLFLSPDISRITSTDVFEIKSQGEDESIVNTITRPQVARQSLFTNVVVSDGDTIVIGGLISDTTAYEITGIPFLKDIPLVGRLFENETEVFDRRNLLIFITVNILDPQGVAYTRLK